MTTTQDLLQTDMDPRKKRRITFAVTSGIAAGVVAAFTSNYVNIWLFPDLPLYLNPASLLTSLILWILVGGMVAGMAGISIEGWRGISLSSASLSLAILLYSFAQSEVSPSLKILGLLVLLTPLAVIVSPLALTFFWLARRFVEVASSKGWRRLWTAFVNLVVILALGTLPSLYTKFSANAETGVRIIHGILQDAAKVSSQDQLHKALLKTEGIYERRNEPYALSQVRSESSTVGVDVTAHYADGYILTCTVILYPGSAPYVTPCKSAQP